LLLLLLLLEDDALTRSVDDEEEENDQSKDTEITTNTQEPQEYCGGVFVLLAIRN
jgi:hypothetical protein